jgi:hypothetical protein
VSIASIRVRGLIFALVLCGAAGARADVLLDEKWGDGSRTESNRPAEAAVFVGQDADVSVADGVLTTKMGPASQKLWTYFTDTEPVKLAIGQTLTASISFIPRAALSDGTSRSFRFGLFHDPTDPRLEEDTNSDGGGANDPWSDATGYAVQFLLAGGEYAGTSPFDLGKRTNLESRSLLGTSGDYTKMSGGTPITLELDKEYRVSLAIERVSETEVNLTARLKQGDEELSSFSISDDGTMLGAQPVDDTFDQLFIRISNAETTANQIDFTNFKVELTKGNYGK